MQKISDAILIVLLVGLLAEALRNLQVELLWSKSNETAQGEWWEVRAFPCSKDDPYPFISNLDVCAYLTVVIFADKVFPQALSTISSYGYENTLPLSRVSDSVVVQF